MRAPVAEFSDRVMALNEIAWRMREASPKPCDLPFALALFSDPNRLPPLEALAESLPRTDRGIALIFRHYDVAEGERERLADTVRMLSQDRGHLFIMARGALPGADGSHAERLSGGILTMPAHDEDEIIAAIKAGADAAFLSPVFATNSHPGAAPLGRQRAVALAQASPLPLFALGGMDEAKASELVGTPFQGFGAIDAFATGMAT